MSTVQPTDKVLIQRGTTQYSTAADLSKAQDTDLLLINRGGVDYKCSYHDWKASQSHAPVIGSLTLADSPQAGRFTSGSFAATATMTDDGTPPAVKSMKAWVGGRLTKKLVATAITASTGGATPTLTFSTDQDLASFTAGDPLVQDVQTFQKGWAVVAPSAVTQEARALVATEDSTLYMGVSNGEIYESRTGPGTNWVKKTSPGSSVYGLGYHAGVLFLITDDKFLYSTDEAGAWHENPTATASLHGALAGLQFNKACFINGTHFLATSKGVFSITDLKNGALKKLSSEDTIAIASNGTRVIWCSNSPAVSSVSYTDDETTVHAFPIGATIGAYGLAVTGSTWYLVGAEGTDAFAAKSINNGASWSRINTSTVGSGTREVLVGCGLMRDGNFVTSRQGNYGGTPPPDVWEYDGTTWTKVIATGRVVWTYVNSHGVLCGIAAGNKLVREGELTPYGFVGSVNVAAKTISLSSSTGTWDVGRSGLGPIKTTANAKLYLKFDAAGAVSDLSSADPGWVAMSGASPYHLTFPATLPSGSAPDVDLPAGTTITAELQAANASGTVVATSNTVTPA